jgi:hypothetical protein
MLDQYANLPTITTRGSASAGVENVHSQAVLPGVPQSVQVLAVRTQAASACSKSVSHFSQW